MRKVKSVLGIAFCATLLACMGGDVERDYHLVALYTDAIAIHESESTTLYWSSPNGATVISSDFDAESASGFMTVSPATTTTYHLKIRLATNDIISRTTTLEVLTYDDQNKESNAKKLQSQSLQ